MKIITHLVKQAPPKNLFGEIIRFNSLRYQDPQLQKIKQNQCFNLILKNFIKKQDKIFTMDTVSKILHNCANDVEEVGNLLYCMLRSFKSYTKQEIKAEFRYKEILKVLDMRGKIAPEKPYYYFFMLVLKKQPFRKQILDFLPPKIRQQIEQKEKLRSKKPKTQT